MPVIYSSLCRIVLVLVMLGLIRIQPGFANPLVSTQTTHSVKAAHCPRHHFSVAPAQGVRHHNKVIHKTIHHTNKKTYHHAAPFHKNKKKVTHLTSHTTYIKKHTVKHKHKHFVTTRVHKTKVKPINQSASQHQMPVQPIQSNTVPAAPQIPKTDLSTTMNNMAPEFTGGPEDNQAVKTENITSENAYSGQRLVAFVHNMIGSLRYTAYRSGGQIFDNQRGVYVADCSHYVDHILQNVFPRSYSALKSFTGATTPDSANYYDFFRRLSSNMRLGWDRINNAKQLEPGDVLVFRYKNAEGATRGGHVMVVMDKPVQDNGALLVRVSDSAFSGHTDDTRAGHSGVGVGTMLLKVNAYTGAPFAYAWNVGSHWVNRVNIAMARPIGFS